MQYCTRNPTLKKPEYTDARDIADLNDNMDYIDGLLEKANLNGAIDPTVSNDIVDGYSINSVWWNVSDHRLFMAESVVTGAAVWRQVYPIVAPGANFDFGTFEVRAQTIQCDVASGTAAMTIVSNTKIPNLNADLLDGLHDTDFVKNSLATAANDFIVATGTATFVKKTLAETQSILGLNGYIPYSLYTTPDDFVVGTGTATAVKKTLAETKTILGITAHTELPRKATVVIGDGAVVITTGLKGGFECPLTGHITAARVMSLDGISGAIAVDVWIDAYGNGIPTDADSKLTPHIDASGTQSEETGLTIDVTVGDWILFNVDSVTSMKMIAVSLTLETV
jgi:hypothetical protein